MSPKEIKSYTWVAACQYDDKKEFRFYSDEFTANDWNDLEEKAQSVVDKSWSEISPYPAPKVVGIIPNAKLALNYGGEIV